MTTTVSIELQTPLEAPITSVDQQHVHAGDAPPTSLITDGAPAGVQEFSLPPVDSGKDAWLFLAACFMLEFMIWGFPFSFGVFQDYYRTHEPFEGSSSIAIIGTCALGIMYLDSPIIIGLGRKYPHYFRFAPVLGLVIMCVGLVSSSFSQSVTDLIATQGVIFAIGGSVCYCTCILYLDEWFVRRKGLAFGVMWSGTGLGGCTIPLLLQFLLDKYGFRTTLRIWSAIVFFSALPLVFYIKPRLPPSLTAQGRPANLGFIKTGPFLLYQLANIIESMGFFLPSIYLPSFARTVLGASSFAGALTVLALNVASVGGTVVMGALTDRLEVTTCIMISTVGTVIGIFLLWGLATNLATLYLFCIVYGVFAGAYTATWPGIMRQITGGPPAEADSATHTLHFDPIMVFGLLAAGRGIGNVVSGPLSEVLIKGLPWHGHAAASYGSGYGPLIAFTGITAVVGGGSFAWRRLGWL